MVIRGEGYMDQREETYKKDPKYKKKRSCGRYTIKYSITTFVDNYKYKRTINKKELQNVYIRLPERTTPVIMHKPHFVKNFLYNFYL